MISPTTESAPLQATIFFLTAWLADLTGDRDGARRSLRTALQWAPGSA